MPSPITSALTTALADVQAKADAQPFDAAIIGGGSAGITALRTLSESGLRTALFEAGPLSLLTHVQSTDLRFDSNLVRTVQQGLSYSPELAGGGQFGSLIGCLGGRGLFWNGAAPRFRPADFAAWPFDASDLDGDYAWAESEFRVTSAYGDTRLCRDLVAKLKGAGFEARPGPYAVDTHPTEEGWLSGTVGNSVAPLLRSGLLTAEPRGATLSTNAVASRIISAGGRVTGVAVKDRADGREYQIAARSVVLAAGAFESTRLVLASGLSHPEGLTGRFISDHLFVRAYFPMPPEAYRDRPEVAIIWIPANDETAFQIEIHLPADNLFNVHERTVWKPDRSQTYAAMVRSFAPVQPRFDNHVEPTDGEGPGAYRVHLGIDGDDMELQKRQVAALERVRQALGADPAPVQSLPLGSSHHECGGLVMGSDPKASVTDGFGRVRGIEGLVVCDAASWPDVSPANPHLTIVALARRQARQLASDLEKAHG